MRKKCDLCNTNATSYCESDEASLCWACDASVHRANFLAAKHTRVVLCRVCHGPTLWAGSGVQLDPAARACPACASDDDGDYVDDSCTADEESDDDDKDDGGSEDDDDQVVPTPINKNS